MPAVHHLMVGTWTPPGAIFTFAFNEETLELKLVKRTEIPQDEPISWMTFDVSTQSSPFLQGIQGPSNSELTLKLQSLADE